MYEKRKIALLDSSTLETPILKEIDNEKKWEKIII